MNDESMTGETLVKSLREVIAEQARCIQDQQHQIIGQQRRIEEQEAEIGALNRHNIELRGAVSALLQPAPSELLAKNMAHPSRGK